MPANLLSSYRPVRADHRTAARIVSNLDLNAPTVRFVRVGPKAPTHPDQTHTTFNGHLVKAAARDPKSMWMVMNICEQLGGLPANAQFSIGDQLRQARPGTVRATQRRQPVGAPAWLDLARTTRPLPTALLGGISDLADTSETFETLWALWALRPPSQNIAGTGDDDRFGHITAALELAGTAATLDAGTSHTHAATLLVIETLLTDGVAACHLGELVAIAHDLLAR